MATEPISAEEMNTMKRTDDQKKYTCIFFDLDHTLWDYETNSRDTLVELYLSYNLVSKGISSADDFLDRFKVVNTELWYSYDRGLIDSTVIRKERFKQILEPFGAYEQTLSEDLSRDYLDICPKKSNLMPHAKQVLDYLVAKEYRLTIITNGFEEIQHQKLTAGNLHPYFDHIITSQKAGHRKPAREIFDFAMELNGIKCHQATMIGDNLITDIGGARAASIDPIFFNSEKITHTETLPHEIDSLHELHSIL